MHEAVSDILIERARVTEGMSRALAVSLFVHSALVAAVVLMPADWRTSRAQPEVPLMTISLGGVSGPDAGGQTPLSGRAVQTVAPPEAKPEPDAPPAPKVPEMTEPARAAKPAPKTKPVERPADKSSSRKPTSGDEIKPGDARVNTGGAAIPFGGLSTGGGGSDGVRLDIQNFCCPEYIQTMVQRIKQTWNQNQGAAGEVWVKFTIRRDGMLTQVEVEKPSGQAMLDLESRRAVLLTRQLPPLPREFTEPYLTVHIAFSYKR
jgi:TonB family protein